MQGDPLKRTLIAVPGGERLDQLLAESASFPNRLWLYGYLLSGLLFPVGHFTICAIIAGHDQARWNVAKS